MRIRRITKKKKNISNRNVRLVETKTLLHKLNVIKNFFFYFFLFDYIIFVFVSRHFNFSALLIHVLIV